jgi:hypothetical protein
MARSTKKLDELAALLEKTGGDPKRLDAVRAAQNFRRSWLDLAKTLSGIRKKRMHERWGYKDFYSYCSEELTLKKATVDKLTISYHTIERHAPQVLNWDGVAKTIPSYEAIDYYSRALGTPKNAAFEDDGEGEAPAPNAANSAPPARLQALSEAVFDEGRPVAELRKTFDPVFFPKPEGSEKLAVINKANAAAKKLADLLPELTGLPETRVHKLEAELGKLRVALDELAEPLREQVAKARAKARKGNKPESAKAPKKKAPRVRTAASE